MFDSESGPGRDERLFAERYSRNSPGRGSGCRRIVATRTTFVSRRIGRDEFLEAAGRGLVTATVVNETYVRDGQTVTSPVGIRLDKAADTPVAVSEEAVLMSPHPLQAPAPDPLRTTQDGVLTVGTVPGHGSLTYSYGDLVVQGFFAHPAW